MGNNATKTLDKWGINPGKLSQKRTKRKGPPRVSTHQAPVQTQLYDSVTGYPLYARVNKVRKQVVVVDDGDDGLHYADVQVLQSTSSASEGNKTFNNHSTTEYATIDFKTPVNIQTPAEPADLFIPPGELKRPNMRTFHK